MHTLFSVHQIVPLESVCLSVLSVGLADNPDVLRTFTKPPPPCLSTNGFTLNVLSSPFLGLMILLARPHENSHYSFYVPLDLSKCHYQTIHVPLFLGISHIATATPFCRSTLSTILCIKNQYIMIQYSVLHNCIVQYSVVQYNTELPCNFYHCTTVQLSALHDTV